MSREAPKWVWGWADETTHVVIDGDIGNVDASEMAAASWDPKTKSYKPTYKPWSKIEEEAEEADRRAVETICIWCGKVCDSLEQLEEHEDECAPE